MIDWILFDLLAAGTLLAAVMVVRSADLVRAVLWLAVALVGTAGLYVTMDAGFLAAIQILLYTGGVITLLLFAVLLTRRSSGALPAGPSGSALRAGVATLALVGLVVATLFRDPGSRGGAAGPMDADRLGAVILGPLALPFEVLSVLLLAAMVGAIVLARRKEA